MSRSFGTESDNVNPGPHTGRAPVASSTNPDRPQPHPRGYPPTQETTSPANQPYPVEVIDPYDPRGVNPQAKVDFDGQPPQRADIQFGPINRESRQHTQTYSPATYAPGQKQTPTQEGSAPGDGAADQYLPLQIDCEASLPEEEGCPECGSPVDLNAKFCPACGEDLQDRLGDNQIQNRSETYTRSIQAETDRQHWKCDSCGSEVTSLGSDRTLHCPFCESTYVAEISTQQSGRQRPEFIIGFGITKERATQRITAWLEDSSWYHPKDLKDAKIVQRLRGIYIPFWSFSTLAQSTWQASIGEYWYRTETYTVRNSKGKTETRTRRVRHTEWWPLAGRHHQYYSGYLVSGSSGLNQSEADAVQPFNLPALQRYQPFFLAGWFSEEYSVAAEQAMQRSLEVFRHWERSNIQAFLPGDTSSNLQTQTSFSGTQSDLCLLPLYMLSYQYNDQNFRVIMNGQTGKVFGQKPIWRTRVNWVIGGVIAIILLIVLIAALLQIRW